MQQSVVIGRQFNGPPKSANGGYVSGVLAGGLTDAGYRGAVEACLHAPPPLDHSLSLGATVEAASLMDGETRIGSAKAVTLALEVPELLSKPIFVGDPIAEDGAFTPFDICFVCGRARHEGDGLCLFSQRVEGHDGLVGVPWHLHQNFAIEDGTIDPKFIWSALDCPGYFACAYGEAALLGRLTAEIFKPLQAGGEAMVFGWSLVDPDARPSQAAMRHSRG